MISPASSLPDGVNDMSLNMMITKPRRWGNNNRQEWPKARHSRKVGCSLPLVHQTSPSSHLRSFAELAIIKTADDTQETKEDYLEPPEEMFYCIINCKSGYEIF